MKQLYVMLWYDSTKPKPTNRRDHIQMSVSVTNTSDLHKTVTDYLHRLDRFIEELQSQLDAYKASGILTPTLKLHFPNKNRICSSLRYSCCVLKYKTDPKMAMMLPIYICDGVNESVIKGVVREITGAIYNTLVRDTQCYTSSILPDMVNMLLTYTNDLPTVSGKNVRRFSKQLKDERLNAEFILKPAQ